MDAYDQLMECYRTWVKTRKWTLKFALHFIDLTVVNSWLEYKECFKRQNIAKAKVLDRLHLKLDLAESLWASIEKRVADFLDKNMMELIIALLLIT